MKNLLKQKKLLKGTWHLMMSWSVIIMVTMVFSLTKLGLLIVMKRVRLTRIAECQLIGKME